MVYQSVAMQWLNVSPPTVLCEQEPEPRDWAFDEPGKEPVSFRTQNVEAVPDDQLPWKSRKDGADAKGGDGAASPSHRDGSSGRGPAQAHHSSAAQQHNDPNYRAGRSRSHHSASRDPPPRRSERQQQQHAAAGTTGDGNAAARSSGSAWRERSAGRGTSSTSQVTGAKRPNAAIATGAAPTSADRSASASSSRPRSPKQQRRR